MSQALLIINSRNYGAWSLRTWLMCRMSGLDFAETLERSDDPSTRAELLQLSPSFLIPRLEHDEIRLWDTLAIAEYLHETFPASELLPLDRAARAHCRSICGELHAGFQSLRSALPMNLKRRHDHGFRVWAGAQSDIDRIVSVWTDCLETYKGGWLFGERPTAADAMYAPECTRFATYGVDLPDRISSYVRTVMSSADMRRWFAQADAERDDLFELEMEMEF